MPKSTQAQEIAKLRQDLSETQVHVQILAAALLTVAERNGTSGWGNMAHLIHVMRETPDTGFARAMARAADVIVERVSLEAGPRWLAEAVRGAGAGDLIAAAPGRLSLVE